MRQLGGLTEIAWLRNVFPDMLWLCSVLIDDPDSALFNCAEVLDAIATELGFFPPSSSEISGEAKPPILTGSLVTFDELPEAARNTALAMLTKGRLYEKVVPEQFAHSLGLYKEAPGAWLLEPWRERGLVANREKGRAHLDRLVTAAADGRTPLATLAKHMFMRAFVRAGRLHVQHGSPIPELFSRFPHALTDVERQMADSFVRASFLSLWSMEAHRMPARLKWARSFWRENWSLFPCGTRQSGAASREDDSEDQIAGAASGFRSQAAHLEQTFLDVALRTDPDIYAPDRYEVLTGIVARILRLTQATADSPLLWADEYGAPLLRAVIESKIVFHWLLLRSDLRLFAKFKDYGRGHLKLLALHVREYASLKTPPRRFAQYADALDREVNAETSEEFQDIDLNKSFAGVSVRQMAIDCDLKKDYDFVFSPASATAHGEWSALDRYALERCQSVLHMWHRIPRKRGSIMLGGGLMEMLLGEADALVKRYSEVIGERLPDST